MSGRILWDKDAIGYWHGQCLACGARFRYVTDSDRAGIDQAHACHDAAPEQAAQPAAQATPAGSGLQAIQAAGALAAALLTAGNETIRVFSAAGGEDGSPTRWTVAWAKGADADRLRAWLEEDGEAAVDEEEDPHGHS